MGLRTLDSLDQTKGTVQLIDSSAAAVILVPQPSSDPNDPLHWSAVKKNVAFLCVCSFTFLTNVSIGGLSPAFFALSLEFDKPITVIAGLLTWCILVLGLANFLWVPVAIKLGKRPVFLFNLLVLCVANIWSAVSGSFGSLLAARIVASVAGGSTEALGAAIVNDIFFLHERGGKMGIYIIFLAWGNSLGPLVGGFIIEGLGWRWLPWICAILTGANLVAVFLFVPETRFPRAAEDIPAPSDAVSHSDGSEKAESKQPHLEVAAHAGDAPRVFASGVARKTWAQELNPWSGVDKEHSFLTLFLRPMLLVPYPAIFWAVLSYSVTLAWVVAVSTVNSFILQAPPYNFSPGINGLINIPAMIGHAVGALLGGYLTDVFVRWRARRNEGIFEPESRLPLLVLPAICVPIGCLMFGFAVQEQMSWAVIFVAYGFINVGLTGVANIGMTYVMDSYFPVAADALLVVNGLKNVVAFGFSYGAVPWITGSGYKDSFSAMAGIHIGIVALAVPLFFFGGRIRQYTGARWPLIWV